MTAATTAAAAHAANGTGAEPTLAVLWKRHRQSTSDRISLLETTAANVLRSTLDGDDATEAAGAAHRLAGFLGIFGFDEGSRAALEAEHLLREPVIDGRLLAEAVTALRSSLLDETRGTAATEERTSGHTVADTGVAIRIVSADPELISRLTVQAAVIGMSVDSSSEVPELKHSTERPAAVIIDEGPVGDAIGSGLLASVATIARRAMVIVITDRDRFEDRAAFAQAGAAGIVPRSQGPAQIVSFLADIVAKGQEQHSVVLACNAGGGLDGALHRALAESGCDLDILPSGEALWDALEERGADLIVVGYSGSTLSGPDLCRIIRAHPRWHRLPVAVLGGPRTSLGQLEESFASGADDYLHVDIHPNALGVRLLGLLSARRLSVARSDVDPVAGTQNRAATERSIDGLLRRTIHSGEPFAFALVAIDRFEQIRADEGTAVGDSLVRRLGASLLGACQGDDVTGRWSDDVFAVGFPGCSGETASERISRVLQSVAGEGIANTSGQLVRCTCSAGIASAPADGSSLASLERTSEGALRRARAVGQAVVRSGERPAPANADVTDVVLVEDDDPMADIVQHALELGQYRFARFSDGADAAVALGERRVRAKVVLLDVGLPSLDGFGVLHELRNRGILEETRVIMLTARSSEEETLRAIGLGATEHITKPFSIPVLLARLDQSCSGAGI